MRVQIMDLNIIMKLVNVDKNMVLLMKLVMDGVFIKQKMIR